MNRNKFLVPVPEDVKVYDLGRIHYDRYTVYMPDGAVFAMSKNASMCYPVGNYSDYPPRVEDKRVTEISRQVSSKIEELRL